MTFYAKHNCWWELHLMSWMPLKVLFFFFNKNKTWWIDKSFHFIIIFGVGHGHSLTLWILGIWSNLFDPVYIVRNSCKPSYTYNLKHFKNKEVSPIWAVKGSFSIIENVNYLLNWTYFRIKKLVLGFKLEASIEKN